MSRYLRAGEIGDGSYTEVPEHLQYKPYTVPPQYTGTSPRYLDERKKGTPQRYEVKPFEAKKGIWAGVSSRHLEPLHPRRQPEKPLQYNEKREFREHKEYLKIAHWDGVEARYLEFKEPPISPRQQIQIQKERDRRLLGWRSNPVGGLSLTFDEIRKRTKRLLGGKPDHLEVKPKRRTPSVIRQYIRFGTPPKHYTTSERYLEESKRARSAPRERLWTPGGGCGGGKWQRKPTSPRSASIHRENDYISDFRATQNERVVKRNFVPRVAKLSPSASLARWESDVKATATESESDNSTIVVGSPAYPDPKRAVSSHSVPSPAPTAPPGSSNHHTSHTHHGEGTILVGPVTVAVPPGAVVRLSSTHRPVANDH